jgi:hypothetical protein
LLAEVAECRTKTIRGDENNAEREPTAATRWKSG